MLTRNKSRGEISLLSDSKEQKIKYSAVKCRICLADGEIPIFGTNDIAENVKEFGKIEIHEDDNLPQYLCDACHSLLEAAILFRSTAKQSDEVLKRVTEHSDEENSDFKNESETYIKKEYLEFDSDSELNDIGEVKSEYESDDEIYNYSATISEVDTLESNDKDFKINEVDIKKDKNEADSEMIMIIVSDKNKDKDEDIAATNTVKVTVQHRKCEVCHKNVNKSLYKEHLQEHREKYKERCNKRYSKVECTFCGKEVSKSYMKIHLKTHGTPEEQAERMIECTICLKKIGKHYYSDHLRRVHDKKQNVANVAETSTSKFCKCPVCDKEFKESEFDLHVARHAGSVKHYICDKCGKVFKHPSAFKTHCLTHGSELKYKCQFCPYRGLHLGLLKVHVRTHTGDYNYKCTICPARFITKSNLSKHLLRHTGVWKFKCEECGKGFYTKRDIDRHTKTVHLTTKNHVCEICGKAYGHRDPLLSHQLKIHKRDAIRRGRVPTYLKNRDQND